MPKAKRSPIDYTPQFGAGIFRPKETIDQELAKLQDGSLGQASSELVAPDTAPLASHETPAGAEQKPPQRQARSARTNGATNERTNERTSDRVRVRHSFDVWQDQLLGLSEIQAERFSRLGRKPKIGELVQEALDAYIAKERKRTNGRTNERSNER
jgi:hypothetical protein